MFTFQVYPDGIRHIRADKRVNEWKTPGKKTIVKCAVNQRQVVIALTGGELVYFEMDPVRNVFLKLIEKNQKVKLNWSDNNRDKKGITLTNAQRSPEKL